MVPFSIRHSIELLERTPDLCRSWFSGLSGEWIQTNEGEATWSVFDIMGHLIHGEKTDWIPRARIILGDDTNKTFPVFDRFAQYETSKGKNMNQLLDEFEKLRAGNLAELEAWNLSESDLAKQGIHPEFGEVTLEELIATWTVHDLNHLAQAARVLAHSYKEKVGPWKEYLRILKNT